MPVRIRDDVDQIARIAATLLASRPPQFITSTINATNEDIHAAVTTARKIVDEAVAQLGDDTAPPRQ